jgi:hypothetical protein
MIRCKMKRWMSNPVNVSKHCQSGYFWLGMIEPFVSFHLKAVSSSRCLFVLQSYRATSALLYYLPCARILLA